MAEAKRPSPDEALRLARERFDEAEDFTLAVEEEFAILDPETLGLVNRFEELQAASVGSDLDGSLVGELIASEVEIRTGRCTDFTEAAQRLGERRAQLLRLADELGVRLAATGTHPWSPWQEQRIIDTPHYRTNDQVLRYVVWRNNSFGLHVHTAIRGADRAIKVSSALRNYLPELLAVSASSPFLENISTGLHSARTQIFTKMFPRCGIPDSFADWDDYARYVKYLWDTNSITEDTQLWWSVRPHLAFPTVEIRICDGQPQLGEAQFLAALLYSVTARIARALDEGEPLPGLPGPPARGELLARDPLRHVRRADRPVRVSVRAGALDAGGARGARRVGAPGRRGDRRGAVPHHSRGERGAAPDREVRAGRDARGDLRRRGPGAGPCLRIRNAAHARWRRSCGTCASRTSS